MSKISLNEPSTVHFMECNVAGNKQGEEVRGSTSHYLIYYVIMCSCYLI